MVRRYATVKEYAIKLFRQKANVGTNRQIAEGMGSDRKQIKHLVARQK